MHGDGSGFKYCEGTVGDRFFVPWREKGGDRVC
jgi:hypothetical protein